MKKRRFFLFGLYFMFCFTISVTASAQGTLPPGVTAIEPEPEAWFTIVPAFPKAGDLIKFDASESIGKDGIVNYQWDTTGDGLIDRFGKTIQKSYLEPGEYPVTLTVHDALGRSKAVTRMIRVGQGGVQLEILSHPAELTVYINGVRRGLTPISLTVEPGIHRIRLRHYWLGTWETEVDLRKLTSLTLDVVL